MFGTLTLVEETCCNCLTHFAMDQELYRRAKETGRTFYCPNGHAQHYTETEVQKLKKQNQNLKARVGWAEDDATRARTEASEVRREKAAIKGQLTKTRNRIANGVCPCCHRTFKQLARHIENKHPDFKKAVS